MLLPILERLHLRDTITHVALYKMCPLCVFTRKKKSVSDNVFPNFSKTSLCCNEVGQK